MMRRLFRLRLWYLDLTVELLEDQKGRVFRDLQAARRERADARVRWKQYSAMGYALSHHDVSAVRPPHG